MTFGLTLYNTISIHALREEGDLYPRVIRYLAHISIHALREEGDPACGAWHGRLCRISIHALREEGDGHPLDFTAFRWYFYPRPPRGGRRLQTLAFTSFLIFLSTPSARRATEALKHPGVHGIISIHALREEGDPAFNRSKITNTAISIHALREEGDEHDLAMDK